MGLQAETGRLACPTVRATASKMLQYTGRQDDRTAGPRVARGAERQTITTGRPPWSGCQRMEHMEPESDEQRATEADLREPDATDEGVLDANEEEQPLVRVRYGLGKELRLFPDAFVVAQKEVHEELSLRLDNIRRMILTPGEHTPSKLVLMFELDDGNLIIAAEGMTNVPGFRRLLARLRELRPEIELDPPNMDEQLMQALDIKRRAQIGCYGVLFGSCILIWAVYLVVALIGAHAPH